VVGFAVDWSIDVGIIVAPTIAKAPSARGGVVTFGSMGAGGTAAFVGESTMVALL